MQKFNFLIGWKRLFIRFWKLFTLALFVFAVRPLSAKAVDDAGKWQYSIATGLHSFYAPVENLKWDRPESVTSIGINHMLGKREVFSLAMQFQYARNQYQGDAGSAQLLAQFLPLVLRKVEVGLGLGAGYRFAFYPSSPLKWNGTQWTPGGAYKGMLQVPVQASAGYRAIKLQKLAVIPFVACQMQALFGYNPDYAPLPDSNFMIGFKFQFIKN
jgi:hypothetical protein